MKHFGREFIEDPKLNTLKRMYIRIFGIPISGMRIRLRRVLPSVQGDFQRIIDLGCGKGIFSFELARRFPNATVVGVDLDEEQVERNRHIAKKYGHKNLSFEVGDLCKLPYEGEFDLALSVDMLEHIEDDQHAIKQILKCIRPGGYLVCHVPALMRIWLFSGMKENFDVIGHQRPGYRLEELKEKLEKGGFEIESISETYGYLETVSNNLSYLITKANQENEMLYALAFPLLNMTAWLGRNQQPKGKGAGVLALARRPS